MVDFSTGFLGSNILEKECCDLTELRCLARELLSKFHSDEKVALLGVMGSGKTALARFFLQELGYKGVVSSPTFTLVEEYYFEKYPADVLLPPPKHQKDLNVLHMDLYRLDGVLGDDFGLRHYLGGGDLVFVEWAEKVKKVEQFITSTIVFDFCGEARVIKLFRSDNCQKKN